MIRVERERGAPARGGFVVPLERVGEQRAAAREQRRARGVALGVIAGVLDEIELRERAASERARGERPFEQLGVPRLELETTAQVRNRADRVAERFGDERSSRKRPTSGPASPRLR